MFDGIRVQCSDQSCDKEYGLSDIAVTSLDYFFDGSDEFPLFNFTVKTKNTFIIATKRTHFCGVCSGD